MLNLHGAKIDDMSNIDMANELFLKKKIVDAVEMYDKILQNNSHDLVALNNKGYALSKLKKYDDALECYNRSLKIKPNDKIVTVNKISLYRKTSRINDAIDLCNNNISEKTDISKASLENININDKKLTEKSPEHNKYLEGNNLEEIDLEIENSEPIVLKNPSEVYLDIYRTARQKAKMAKNAAIKAYLEAKRIKELYMLDVADSSEEEEETTDEESELFSEN